MSAWAKPGVKCVCIDGVRPDSYGFYRLKTGPQTNGVYTIVEVRFNARGLPLLVLKEFPDIGNGTGWEIDHFRPLITLEQDVAQFTHHLIREGADA